ncbi:MAG: response regulator [Rhodospirillaceae bacterium]|nr:response regulator [Rhodospirillaceae bacterium]
MVVDDDAFVRSVVQGVLQAAGVSSLRLCASGAEALTAVADFHPGLILLDVVMPDMDGPATLASLAARLPSLPPVIFLTARDDKDIKADVTTVAGVIAKPFKPTELVDAIVRVLQQRGVQPRPAFQPAAKARRLAAVAEAFTRNLPPTASRIEAVWTRLQNDGWRRDTAEAILADAHSLAGSAGLFERHGLSAAAHTAERLLLNALKLERPPEPAEMQKMAEAVTMLIAACREPAAAC